MPTALRSVSPARRVALGLTSLGILVGLAPATPASAATTPAATTPAATTPSGPPPPCDLIRGAELGITSTWRIVRTGSPFEVSADATVIACRRDVPGPAQVRVLGTSKVIDDGGEDSETPSGGPYLTLEAFEGGRAVILSRTFAGPSFYDSTGSITYVDLDRGARTTLSTDYAYASVETSDRGRYRGLQTVMTAAGGLAFAPVREDPPAKRATGPWTLWDAAGQRAAPAGLTDVALSRGTGRRGATGADAAGIYFRDAAGKPRRLALSGAAATDALPVDPALAWQTLPLERTPKQSGRYNAELLVAPSTVAPDYTFGSAPQLEFSTDNEDRKAVIRILDEDQERRLGTLAPGSYPELKVVASSPGVAFLIGRFAGHPKQRRVRLATTSRKATAFFDVPARHAMERPGMIATLGGLQALADGDRLRLWNYPRGRVHRVKGVHDLAITDDNRGLYATDRAGKVSFRAR